TNVAAGTEDTDAVNLAQLNEVAGETSAAATRYLKAAGANDGTDDAVVNDQLRVAIGPHAESNGAYAIAIGYNASTHGNYAGTAIGGGFANDPTRQNIAGQFGTAVGFGTQAKGVGDTAMGTYANTGDTIDPTSDLTNSYRTAIGYKAFASGDAAIAVGTFNTATGHRSTALGYEADALADDSVALGSESLADEANTVSVGREGFERRIVNVADGDLSATSTDAVNGRQLFGAMDAAAAALGGGAAVTAGGFVAPTYVIQGSSYNNVGAALDALDAKVTEIDGRVDTLEGSPNVASTDSDAPPTASSNGELDRSSGDASNRVA